MWSLDKNGMFNYPNIISRQAWDVLQSFLPLILNTSSETMGWLGRTAGECQTHLGTPLKKILSGFMQDQDPQFISKF